MKILVSKREYEVIEEPQSHILVPTRKQLHGWWPGKRECTSERMLINPYNGCGIGCFYCYARAFPGYFRSFRDYGVITVAKDFDQVVAEQLDSIDIATCGYLSPVTDPFQSLNAQYHLSEKIIKVFVERNIPIEFITKASIPGEVIGLNQEFMSSRNCEGIDIPLYKREGRKFYPAVDCAGDCLHCTDPRCGIEDLAMGRRSSKKDWRLKDYRRWSKKI
ncbi:MAG: hypothetical protein ACE5HR_07585 [bacterium]